MRKHRTAITLVAVVALGGIIWFLLPASPDPQLVKVQQLQEQLFNPDTKPEDRRQAGEQLRGEVEKLSEEQRDQLMRDMRDNPPPPFRQMQQNMVAFFKLSEADRIKELDKQIDEMEKRRKEFQQRGGERGPGGPGGPPGGFRNMSEQQRTEFRKKMLDNTSAQQRGMFSEYFNALESRRKQRGLPPMRGPGG